MKRSVIRSPQRLHSVDIILALEPVVPVDPAELFACKQSGLPWWLNGGGGGKDDIGGERADDAIDAAGSTYGNNYSRTVYYYKHTLE